MLHQHRKWWPYTNDYNDEWVVLFCVTFLELKLLEKQPITTSDLKVIKRHILMIL